MTDSQKHIIGLIFYPGMTSLDIVGPQQVFSALPGIQIHLKTPLHIEIFHPLIGFSLFYISSSLVHRASHILSPTIHQNEQV